MSNYNQSGEVPRLSAGQRALLGALIEHPDSTVTELAVAARVSTTTVRDALRTFEEIGAAVRCALPNSGGRPAPEIWLASRDALAIIGRPRRVAIRDSLLDSLDDQGDATALEKVLATLRLQPDLPIGDISWCTALSRASVIEVLASLERQDVVCRIERRGVSGGRLADGWRLLGRDEPPRFGI